MMRLVLASGNAHKARELAGLAAAAGLPARIVPAGEVGGMPPVAEDTGSFEGNVRRKAAALVPRLPEGAWALADDSGLCVDALDGGPGVESAYYAGPAGDPAANLAKLVLAMRGVPPHSRGARFVCVLALASREGAFHLFRGECAGNLTLEPRGCGGFGYDPLFVPSGHTLTFAELGEEAKATLSHRARAFARMAAWLRSSGAK